VLIIPNKALVNTSGMEEPKGLMSCEQPHVLLKSQ